MKLGEKTVDLLKSTSIIPMKFVPLTGEGVEACHLRFIRMLVKGLKGGYKLCSVEIVAKK